MATVPPPAPPVNAGRAARRRTPAKTASPRPSSPTRSASPPPRLLIVLSTTQRMVPVVVDYPAGTPGTLAAITRDQHAQAITPAAAAAYEAMELCAGCATVKPDALHCLDYVILFPQPKPGGRWTWEALDDNGDTLRARTLAEFRQMAGLD